MIFVGERKVVKITLPGPATRLNCYIVGPDGTNSRHVEFDYPCDEIARNDDTHYTFTTPPHLLTGRYEIEILTTIDGIDRITRIGGYSVSPVTSPDLAADVGATT